MSRESDARTAHDLFLLLLNLTQVREQEQLGRLFAQAIGSLWPEVRFSFSETAPTAQVALPIATLNHEFGHFVVEGGYDCLDAEHKALLHNAVKMFAVLLEKANGERLLASHSERLDDLVRVRTRELMSTNEELARVNQKLLCALRERDRAEQERERLFRISVDPLCVAGFDGYFKQLNSAWCRVLGYDESEMLSQPWISFVHPDDRAATLVAQAKLSAGHPVILFENRYRNKDGTYRLLSWNAYPVMRERFIYCTARDITERRQTDERMFQTRKLEALGQLASGVAHDFNNQLTGILGYTDLLRQETADQPTLTDYADQISRAARRAGDLTRKLLAYARKGTLGYGAVDVHELVHEVASLLRPSIDRGIELRLELLAEYAVVIGDPTQLQNAILNLAINARDAMPHGGTLTFATSNPPLGDKDCRINGFSVEPGRYLQLDVGDTGTGMDPQTLNRIFEPFFTTKPQGEGTGMGLAEVYGTVTEHHGALRVRSQPGHGSTFTLLLRGDPEAIVRSETPDRQVAPDHGTAHILVVDDERTVRRMASEMLTRLGYTVDTCENGVQAVEKQQTSANPYDLVLLDLVMPVMSGAQTFERLRARDPDLSILVSSGYGVDHAAQDLLDRGAAGFVQKPYRVEELARLVANTLEAVRRPRPSGITCCRGRAVS